MNENFIEEENTIYEIDPNCQIEKRKKEENIWQRQSCQENFPVRERRDDRREERERTDCKREDCRRREGRDNKEMLCLLILILILCNIN